VHNARRCPLSDEADYGLQAKGKAPLDSSLPDRRWVTICGQRGLLSELPTSMTPEEIHGFSLERSLA